LIALVAAGVGVVLLTGYGRLSRRRVTTDPVRRVYDRFCRQLARAGLKRAPHEGPMDFARRCARQRPAQAPVIGEITRLYLAVRYSPSSTPVLMQAFRQRVSGFRG